eukprot:11767254-Karenia_brevis.AAC.1
MAPPTPQGAPVPVTPEGEPGMEDDALLTDSDCLPPETVETSSDDGSRWVRYRSLDVNPLESADSEIEDDEPEDIFMTPESMPEEGLAAQETEIEPSSTKDEMADDESACSEEDDEEEQPVQETSGPEEAEPADNDENHR